MTNFILNFILFVWPSQRTKDPRL